MLECMMYMGEAYENLDFLEKSKEIYEEIYEIKKKHYL